MPTPPAPPTLSTASVGVEPLTLNPRPRHSSPEVLAPAGSLAHLKAAIHYGADAVYCGGQEFGMRSAPKNFSLDDFAEAVAFAHARNTRVYVTCNVLPRNDEIADLNRYIAELAEIGVDAIIVTDIGVLMSARAIAPDLDIHISTQAGVTNWQAATALHQLGASRVVLARELTLEAIRDIRAHVPSDLEIEAFVHGSMCMAFSGRCLISNHLTGRDANHGDCAQSCRWKYHVVEEKRPGEFFPVEVSHDGTFIFSSHDMNMVDHIADVLDAGVTSLKIEGRAKSVYYVAAMANAYAAAVDAYLAGEAVPPWVSAEPERVTHRHYSTGFYYPDAPAGEDIVTGGYLNPWQWVGEVVAVAPDPETSTSTSTHAAKVTIKSRNKIVPGQLLEFLMPGRAPIEWQLPAAGITDENGAPVGEINHPAHLFTITLDANAVDPVTGEHLERVLQPGVLLRSPKMR